MGHNALGAGQIIDQGARLVDEAIASGSMFGYECGWKYLQPVCAIAVPPSFHANVLHTAGFEFRVLGFRFRLSHTLNPGC